MHTNSLPTCIHNLGVNLLKRWKRNHSRNHTLYKRKDQIEAHLVIWWQTVQNQKRRQNQIVDKLNPIVDMSLHIHTHWYLFVYRVKEWLHNIFEVTLVKKSSVSSVPWQLDGAFLCELVKYHRRECAMCVIWVEGPSPWQHVNGIRGRPIVRLCRKFPRTSLGYCRSSPRCCWWVESAIHRSEKPHWGCFSVFISHSLMKIINQCQWGQNIKPVFM